MGGIEVAKPKLTPDAPRPVAKTTSPGLAAAMQGGGLSPQERFLYDMHLANLKNAPVKNADGSTSTLKTINIGVDGGTVNIPTVWGGRVVPNKEAIANAQRVGLNKFPIYKSRQEAETRYNAIHKFMEMDVK